MWSDRVFLVLGCILHSHSVVSLWSCTQNSDCSTTLGAICTNGDCVCPAGTQSILGGTVCGNAAPYYTSVCFEDHQCSHLVTNFECRLINEETGVRNCYCQEGFHYFLGRCWKSIDFGEPCNRDEECMSIMRDPFSLSCQEGTCACAAGYYERQRGECRQIANAPGQGCVLDEDCQFEGGVCNINNFQCVLATTLKSSQIKSDEPVLKYEDSPIQDFSANVTGTRNHGTPCGTGGTCNSPFVCSNLGACVCPTGYYASPNGAQCWAELGSPSTNQQCQGFLAQNINNVCKCPANVYYEENMRDCVKATRRVSDACVTDQMCHTFGSAARCGAPQEPFYLRSCECIPGQAVWDEERSMCRLFVGIGEACQVNSDCLAGNQEILCVENSEGVGICTCPEGTSPVDGLCLTSGLELGEQCQASAECSGTEHSVCEDSVCSCDADYQQIDNYCAPTIGGTCLVDDDCSIENTECVAQDDASALTCQCSEDYVSANDVCWPKLTSISTVCNVTAQCTTLLGPASTCVEASCECSPGYHYRDSGCWPQIGLFGSCSRNSECFLQEDSQRVVCRNSLCQCSFDYPYSEQLNTCVSSATMTLGSIFTIVLGVLYSIYLN
ncbi:prion-like-(Q/N-rich) domain-bearing protein 25 [Trichoplusia ni]|uniref:Prion-like-(Q/N-rich) domain-bearing protein 25 n=1 Tax=Trichoplusia ni TaxID=7111 RepID=A0A7E5X4B2_TRINI|nr:prion-like-(Q/N-rich) domain-bearing protein 25 [Trichoplusia ni]